MLTVRAFTQWHLPRVFRELGIPRFPEELKVSGLENFAGSVARVLRAKHEAYQQVSKSLEAERAAYDRALQEGVEEDELPTIPSAYDEAIARRAAVDAQCAWELARDLPQAWAGVAETETRFRARVASVAKASPKVRRTLELLSLPESALRDREELREHLLLYVAPNRVTVLAEAYRNRQTLDAYLRNAKAEPEAPGYQEKIFWPVATGQDPAEPEAAAWAAFALEHRDVDGEITTRFEFNIDAEKLAHAGVPVSYARLFEKTRWGKYPAKLVYKAWMDGIPPEYASALL